MNNSFSRGVISICNAQNDNNNISLDDEISLLETTLSDAIEEDSKICNNSKNTINHTLSVRTKETYLENLDPYNIEVKNTNGDDNLSRQLTYPAKPYVFSTTQHMKLSDKSILHNTNTTFETKSDEELINTQINTTPVEICNNFKSLVNVQNQDCDIIISQCDSSLEGYKQCSSTASCNSEIRCINYDKDFVHVNDKSSEIKSEYNITLNVDNISDPESKIFIKKESCATNLIKIPGTSLHNTIAISKKQEMDPSTCDVLPSNNDIMSNEAPNVTTKCLANGNELKVEENSTTIVLPSDDHLLNNIAACTPDNLPNSSCSEELKNENETQVAEFDNKLELKNENETQVAKSDNKLEDVIPYNLFTENSGSSNKTTGINQCNGNSDKDCKKKIFCSTPITEKNDRSNLKSTDNGLTNGFGQVSPLNTPNLKSKMNLKRKNKSLTIIEEVDEEPTCEDKKIKRDEGSEYNKKAASKVKDDSVLSCFEAPAKAILKMWQPSCFSRPSGATPYFILDEIDESETEDTNQIREEVKEQPTDDFELACKSLNEELMKSSSNIENLEKYHSQVQLESLIDDEKFDEILLELTQQFELDDKTCLSLRSMEMDSQLEEADKTIMNISSEYLCKDTVKSDCITNNSMNRDASSEGDTTVIERKDDVEQDEERGCRSTVNVTVKVITDTSSEDSRFNNTSNENPDEVKKELSIVYADEKDKEKDEEDFLLEEEIDAKKKPYEFFEYVSTDPKENEDNYHPEWKQLGNLTTDEERYAAVRNRWRSLVPPNPNKDLTCRQWRKRNNLPPLNIGSDNNNFKVSDSDRNQHCTMVFELKIKRIVQELEDRRMAIFFQRNRAFEDLGMNQDNDQRRLLMRGCTDRDIGNLRARHLAECRQLKDSYDRELRIIEKEAEDRITSLKEASNEVTRFQKFYKGVGDTGDEVCLYMTDLEVQELLETEEMLEQYQKFYD